MTSTGLVYDKRMEAHSDPTGFHVECPERTGRIFGLLESQGLAGRCQRIAATFATEEQLCRVHGEAHVKSMLGLKDLPKRKRM